MADRMRFVTLRPDRGWAEEILSQDGGPNTNHTAENRKMATDIAMNIGEALAGEGNEIAHIDLLIGKKEGPVGLAFANALANQSAGHTSIFWDLCNLGFTDVAIMHRRAAERETANLEKIRTQTRVAAEVVSSYETRQAAIRQIKEGREGLVEALDSLKLNFLNIRQGAELPRATRPIEVLQPIQALAQTRLDYLDSVLDYNRAQFRLKRAIGQQP